MGWPISVTVSDEDDKVEIRLELDETCGDCGGSGSGYCSMGGICATCKGVGYRPTKLGNAILEFVNRHTPESEGDNG